MGESIEKHSELDVCSLKERHGGAEGTVALIVAGGGMDLTRSRVERSLGGLTSVHGASGRIQKGAIVNHNPIFII